MEKKKEILLFSHRVKERGRLLLCCPLSLAEKKGGKRGDKAGGGAEAAACRNAGG